MKVGGVAARRSAVEREHPAFPQLCCGPSAPPSHPAPQHSGDTWVLRSRLAGQREPHLPCGASQGGGGRGGARV